MHNDSDSDDRDNGGAVVAIGLIVILLLLMGAGAYFFIGRQSMAVAEAERALLAEADARMQAEQARAVAETVVQAAARSDSNKLSNDDREIRSAVESVLRIQEEAWNRGDLDVFMEHYWKSEELTFSSGGETTRGWADTLDRYRKRYPTPEKMGRVKFSGLEITPLGDSAALVLGQWSLERESEPLSGNFSLVVRKLADRWLVIHDHTSRKATP